MPIPAMSFAVMPACSIASRQTITVEVQMSSGSCSTQPDAGKCCGNSCCARAAIEMSLRNTIAREEVVPWSMARTKDMEAPFGVILLFSWRYPVGIIVSRQRERIGGGRSSPPRSSGRATTHVEGLGQRMRKWYMLGGQMGRHDLHFLSVRRLRRDRIWRLLPAFTAQFRGPAAR